MLEMIKVDESIESNEKRVNAVNFFKQYVSNCDTGLLTSIVKFSTGFSTLSSLNNPHIFIRFTDNSLPQSDVCFNVLKLPVQYSTYAEFENKMTVAFVHGCEGYGTM